MKFEVKDFVWLIGVIIALVVGFILYNKGMDMTGAAVGLVAAAFGFSKERKRRRIKREAKAEAAKGDVRDLVDDINRDFPGGVRDPDED